MMTVEPDPPPLMCQLEDREGAGGHGTKVAAQQGGLEHMRQAIWFYNRDLTRGP